MAVGTWQLTDDEKVITDAVDFVLDPFIIICIIGAITFTIAFLGCVGAVREHILMLKSVSDQKVQTLPNVTNYPIVT